MVKYQPAIAGDTGDAGSVPGLGRSPEEGMATHSSIFPWKMPLTEEPGRLINLYAVCCSLRNNIYASNIMLSLKTGDYLRDINNSQSSLQLGRVLKPVLGYRIRAGMPCLLTASWLESFRGILSRLSSSAAGLPSGPDSRTSTMWTKTSCQSI